MGQYAGVPKSFDWMKANGYVRSTPNAMWGPQDNSWWKRPNWNQPQAMTQGGGGGAGAEAFSPYTNNIMDLMKPFQEKALGLMDPGSDYYKSMLQRMRQDIGADTAAKERSAALASAESGFGAGANPQLMQMQSQLGEAGLEAQGRAATDLNLAAPQLGMQFANMARQGYENLANFGEGQRRFDVGTGLQQQQMAQQMEQWRQEQEFQRWMAMQQQLNAAQQGGGGGYGYGYGYGGSSSALGKYGVGMGVA